MERFVLYMSTAIKIIIPHKKEFVKAENTSVLLFIICKEFIAISDTGKPAIKKQPIAFPIIATSKRPRNLVRFD